MSHVYSPKIHCTVRDNPQLPEVNIESFSDRYQLEGGLAKASQQQWVEQHTVCA